MSVNNTTLHLYTIKIVYCQGDMFRPLLGHLQALLEKQIQDLSISQCIVGSQMLTDFISHSYNTICKRLESNNALIFR